MAKAITEWDVVGASIRKEDREILSFYIDIVPVDDSRAEFWAVRPAGADFSYWTPTTHEFLYPTPEEAYAVMVVARMTGRRPKSSLYKERSFP